VTGACALAQVVHGDPPDGTDIDRTRVPMQAVSSSMITELRVAEHLPPSGIHALSTLQVSPNGRLTLTTRACRLPEMGGYVGVLVLIYGAGRTPQWLWNSIPTAFGIEPVVGDSAQVTITVKHEAQSDMLASARYVAIKQFACPSGDAWLDIKGWLDTAQSPTYGFDAVRDTARELCLPRRSVGDGSSADGSDCRPTALQG